MDTIDLPSILELERGPIYLSLCGCKTLTSLSSANSKIIDKHLYIYCIVNHQHIIGINTKTKCIKPIIYNVARRRDVKGNKESFQNLCISNDGNYLSAILQREIIIIKLEHSENQNSNSMHLISYKTRGWKLSQTLAFHPKNECIAFGDARGAINLWHDFISLFLDSSNWNLSFLKNKLQTNNSNKQIKKAFLSINEWLN